MDNNTQLIKVPFAKDPVNLGDYDELVAQGITSFGIMNRVNRYGCEWESLVDNNTYPPATLVNGNVVPNPTYWKLNCGVPGNYGLNQKVVSNTLAINEEIQRAKNAERILSNLVDTEKNRAEDVESLHNTRIETLESEVGTGGSIDSRINNAVTTETSRAQIAEQLLQEQYNALTQSDIIVGALPASGTKNLIYRVPGTNTYSDYMWNGSSFVKMATYDNAVDNVPTDGSNNLVKSGGITTKYGIESYIKSLTPADYAGIIWAGEESGIIPAVASYNGYVIPLVEGRSYEIDFSEINTYGAYPASGMTYIRRILSGARFTATSDEKYGLITVPTESPNVSVLHFDSGMYENADKIDVCNRKYGLSPAWMIWDGSNVINYTPTVNSVLIYVPKYKNIICIGGLGERATDERVYSLGAHVFPRKPILNNPSPYNVPAYSTRGVYMDGMWQIDISGYNNTEGCYLMFIISPWSAINFSSLYVSMPDRQYNDYYRLQGKNVLCLGDSIMEFDNYDNYNIPGYMTQFIGKKAIDCGIGGTRLSRRETIDVTTIGGSYAALDVVSLAYAINSGDFTQQVAAAEYLKNNADDDNTYQISTLQAVDFNSLDYVVILAGTNDWTGNAEIGTDTDEGDYSTIKGAIRMITRLILSRYKHIKLLFVTPPVRYYQTKDRSHWCDVWENTNGNTLTDVVNGIISATKFNTLPVLDIYNSLGWNEFNFDVYFYDKTISGEDKVDPTHPRSGFKQIALKICDYIENY